jgi:cytochrome b561
VRWLFASARGWTVSLFFIAPLPTSGDRALVKVFFVIVAGLHVVAAFVHLFYYRDGVMRRILIGELYHEITHGS